MLGMVGKSPESKSCYLISGKSPFKCESVNTNLCLTESLQNDQYFYGEVFYPQLNLAIKNSNGMLFTASLRSDPTETNC